jgi:hypothetical protein
VLVQVFSTKLSPASSLPETSTGNAIDTRSLLLRL